METTDPSCTPRRRLLVVAASVLLAAGAAACGDDGGDLRADTRSVDPSSAAETGEGDDGDGVGSTAGDPASADVLGSTTAELSTGPIDDRPATVRIDVIRLERNGDLVELSMRMTNETPEPSDGSDPQEFDIGTAWGDGAGVGQGYDASAIGLVDGEAQQLYLPVLDSEGNCLCSKGFGNEPIPPGGSRTVDATFGGVPEDVAELDVRLPNFPTITGVPVG